MPFVFQRVLQENPRASYSELGRKIGCSRHTARDHLNSLYEQEILYPPQWRLLINSHVHEHIYLLRVDDPESFLISLEGQKWIYRHCALGGPFNLLIYSYVPIDFSQFEGYEQTFLSGVRSNYHVPRTPQQSYETAFKHILQRCETNPSVNYPSSRFIIESKTLS